MLVHRPGRVPDPVAAAVAAAAAASPSQHSSRLRCKGWRERDSDGIGLAIIPALEKSVSDAAPINTVSASITADDRDACCTRLTSHGRDMKQREHAVLSCASPSGRSEESSAAFPVADFLSRCYLCRKRLYGKDIYMYGGEKDFCSTECRYRQIVADDFNEKRGSHVSKSSDDFNEKHDLNPT